MQTHQRTGRKRYDPKKHKPDLDSPWLFLGLESARQEDPPTTYPCPGCGAKPGEWVLAPRWRHVLGTLRLCSECAVDREVIEMHLRDDRPPDPEFCPHPKGSAAKIRLMAERAAAGLNIFQIWDDVLTPAPFNVPRGAPDHRACDGETGVEKCKLGWRVRPFWRGRKWPLGTFPTEGEARDRAKRFWKKHPPETRPAPLIWLPTSDEDRAAAIEEEHAVEWLRAHGTPKPVVKKIAQRYRKELREKRIRLPGEVVLQELRRRLIAATGPILFVGSVDESAEAAECLIGA